MHQTNQSTSLLMEQMVLVNMKIGGTWFLSPPARRGGRWGFGWSTRKKPWRKRQKLGKQSVQHMDRKNEES